MQFEPHELTTEPDVPVSQRGGGFLPLRYEDVSQDGRLLIEPVTHAIGAAVWRSVLSDHPLVPRLVSEGILPILSRLRVESGGGPIGVQAPIECRGGFDLLRAVDAQGRSRFRVDMFADLHGTRGRQHPPQPPGAGEMIPLARIVAEHVLTKPFAPAGQRVVDTLPDLGDSIAVRDVAWSAPTEAMTLPPGAEAIDDAFALDPCPIVFGLGHTDSNQHVNSLVYPRLLEEAALRRFHALGLDTKRLARFVDVAFRKPCFAGDRVRIQLRVYRSGAELGILGAFIDAGEALGVGPAPSDRSYAFARMHFVE